MTIERKELISEYVRHRMEMGDIDSDDEFLSNEELEQRYLGYAATLTDEQLIRICNSYAQAD